MKAHPRNAGDVEGRMLPAKDGEIGTIAANSA